MTTNLDPILTGDSQLFRAAAYDTDGVTTVTPTSCACSVYDSAGTAIVTSAAGATGAGYAQYNWTGTATAGEYQAVLVVVMPGGVVKSEDFHLTVRSKPPAFTTDLTTDIGVVRFELGDDVELQGVLPDSRNLTDGQVQALLDREGSVMRAVAAACETLARQWARVANISVGGRSESLGAVAEQWSKRGTELRRQYGGGGAGGFSIGAKRTDGYQQYWDDFGVSTLVPGTDYTVLP